MKLPKSLLSKAALAMGALFCPVAASAAEDLLRIHSNPSETLIQVEGDKDDEWRFQSSTDLANWTNAPAVGSVFSDAGAARLPDGNAGPQLFLRAVRTDGLFDSSMLRTVHLTFTNANWATLLASARTSGGNVPAYFALDNGVVSTNVGARYKGNSSYQMSGAKKSINLDINYTNSDARVMGYRAINLNNAAGDETIMREPLYFGVLGTYAPCPRGAMARVFINEAYWGVYSMVDQINNDLLDEWFPSHDGDRWRAPNAGGGTGGGGGGGGGMFTSAASAFSYLGPNVLSYRSNYELKSDNSTNAWERLVNAITVLNNTPAAQLRDKVEDVFAVDRWLWFLAVENIFVDDDSYWYKGADYAFYYEPESGRIHPVEHDGNEAFFSAMGIDYRLSPVQGSTGANRPLLLKLLGIPELRQRYLAHMRAVLEEKFNPGYLTPEINRYHYLTAADIIADPKKNYTMTTYTNDLVALKTYVTNRYRFLTNHAELLPLPPRIASVQGPAVSPSPSDAPFISAQVEAAETNGIDSVWLYWRDKPYGRFSSTQMLDDGAHQDGISGDGIFGAATTNFPAGNKIHYYVEARSANPAKAAVFSPARAEQATYSYQVALTSAESTPVVINELMASNTGAVADPQGEFDDWIELRNMTGEPADLGGKYLTDSADNPRKWQFPAGTTIPAHGYLVVWADENGSDTPGLHASFKLSAEGEEVLLIDTDANQNQILDSVTFGAQSTDLSYGRPSANPKAFEIMSPTPGTQNP